MDVLLLKWKNHRNRFFSVLKNLRTKETYTDVTLACEGQFFASHRLVLATCSDYFAQIFESTPCKSPVVILGDIEAKHIEYLLDYMYYGEVHVPQRELEDLIKVAESLQIKGLTMTNQNTSNKRPLKNKTESPAKKLKVRPTVDDSRKQDTEADSPAALEDEESLSAPSLPTHEQLTIVPDIMKMDGYKADETTSHDKSHLMEGFSLGQENSRHFLDDSPGVSFNENSFNIPEIILQPSKRGTPVKPVTKNVSEQSVDKMCPFCGRYVQKPKDLRKHIRIHTGEKPYKCTKCVKSFTQRSNMNTHMLRHLQQDTIDSQFEPINDHN